MINDDDDDDSSSAGSVVGGGTDDDFALSNRCVLHLDLDSFFMSVHARHDPSLRPLNARPAVLWQYQDVICANRPAKALGVRKHMRPDAARDLVAAGGGVLVHAYSRSWPGPRVRYGPYNAASREFFAALDGALRAEVGGPSATAAAAVVVERGSIDEGYVELPPSRRARPGTSRRSAAVSARGSRGRRACPSPWGAAPTSWQG